MLVERTVCAPSRLNYGELLITLFLNVVALCAQNFRLYDLTWRSGIDMSTRTNEVNRTAAGKKVHIRVDNPVSNRKATERAWITEVLHVP
jgi:hypothetical protein